MDIYTIFLAIIISTEVLPVKGQELKAQLLDTQLPTGLYNSAIIYDGDDSIYLFGGTKSGSQSTLEILRFHISSEVVEIIGKIPDMSGKGSLQMDENGDLFYFGGYWPNYKDVYKYSKLTNETVTVAVLPYDVFGCATLNHLGNSNTTFILGGYGNPYSYMTFDMGTLTSTPAENLPFGISKISAARVHNNAYLFGESSNHSVVKLDLDTLETEVAPTAFPTLSYTSSAISNGEFVYVIGGYREIEAGIPTNGIIQFNPENFEHRFIPVENFPVQGNTYLNLAPHSVFVEKLNRIYMLGGLSSDPSVAFDGIWYIDLDPVSSLPTTTEEVTDQTSPATITEWPTSSTTPYPDIINCVNKTNGMYPHPLDCSMFVGCHNGEVEIYSCPPPLLFDPVGKTCDDPSHVDCYLTCIGRPDGPHPHPHECSFFIICTNEDMAVYQCPPPLLFHPEDRRCTFSEEVECQNNDF